MRDAREKLLTLVNRATSPTESGDNEARTAAVEACKLLVKHPELVANASDVSAESIHRANLSVVHPDAERLREWRALMKLKLLRECHASQPTVCADCGKTIAQGEPVVEHANDSLSTHLGCAGWWWKFQPLRAVDLDIAS